MRKQKKKRKVRKDVLEKNKQQIVSLLGEKEAQKYFDNRQGYVNNLLEKDIKKMRLIPDERIQKQINILEKLRSVVFVPKEKVETRKSDLLELLEKCPTDYDECEANYDGSKFAEWNKKVKAQLNDLLEVYEKDILERFEELQEEIKELRENLSGHEHLSNGKAVQDL